MSDKNFLSFEKEKINNLKFALHFSRSLESQPSFFKLPNFFINQIFVIFGLKNYKCKIIKLNRYLLRNIFYTLIYILYYNFTSYEISREIFCDDLSQYFYA